MTSALRSLGLRERVAVGIFARRLSLYSDARFRSPGGGDGLTGSISVRERSASTVSVSVYLALAAS